MTYVARLLWFVISIFFGAMDYLFVCLWTIAPIRLPGLRSRNTKLRTICAHIHTSADLDHDLWEPRFSTSHDLIADLSNVTSNLTPCWPISTVYPHYLVTGSLGVRRPEAYGMELPTLNRATKSLPYRRYAQWWAWLEGRRYRVDGFGKTVGHQKSDSIDSSKKIRVANITCFGKIFPYTSYLFREPLRNKNLYRDGIAHRKSSEKGSEEVFLKMLIFIHIYLTLSLPYSFTLYLHKYFFISISHNQT